MLLSSITARKDEITLKEWIPVRTYTERQPINAFERRLDQIISWNDTPQTK